jgi:thioredoxin 1
MNFKFSFLIAIFSIVFHACAQNPAITTVSVNEFAAAIAKDTNQIIDVRTIDEYTGGHIAFAKNFDQAENDFEKQIQTLDKSKPVYIYCLSGGRSGSAAKRMAKQGFTKIINLDGGIMAWRNNAKTLVLDRPQSKPGMTYEDFKAMIAKDKNVLVEFYASWCGPCKILKPVVEEIEKENTEKLKVFYIDVDKHKELADTLKLASIPVLQGFKEGKKKWQTLGVVSKKEILKKLSL